MCLACTSANGQWQWAASLPHSKTPLLLLRGACLQATLEDQDAKVKQGSMLGVAADSAPWVAAGLACSGLLQMMLDDALMLVDAGSDSAALVRCARLHRSQSADSGCFAECALLANTLTLANTHPHLDASAIPAGRGVHPGI